MGKPSDFYCRMWTSPYKRARQTADGIRAACGTEWISDTREDFRLAEQAFGLFEGSAWGSELEHAYPNEVAYYRKAAKFAGRFYAKVPLGESRMDVTLRVKQFFGTLQRDAQRHGICNVVVVSHGVTLRAFLKEWLHHVRVAAERAGGGRTNDARAERRVVRAGTQSGQRVRAPGRQVC